MTTSGMHARKAKLKNHLVSAKARIKQHVTPRRVILLAAAACSAFLLLVTLRALHSAAARGADAARAAEGVSTAAADSATPAAQVAVHDGECAKVVPAAVAAALVHYATSSETPRQTLAEAAAAARALSRRAPCNLLLFGLGDDAALWAALNHGGRTLFLDAHQITYQQDLPAGDELLALRDSPDCAAANKPLSPDDLERSPCALAPRGLPAAFYEAEWDVIVLNAPVPGAIYTAGVVGRARSPGVGETDVVVHGVDSPKEERLARAFLCEAYVKEEAGRTRRFAVPSHRDKEAMPFCP